MAKSLYLINPRPELPKPPPPDHSDMLLALWDGKDNNALGGTAQVVRYHLGSDMPGFTDERSHRAQKGDALIYHIVASRDRTGGEPREGLQPGQERWMSER